MQGDLEHGSTDVARYATQQTVSVYRSSLSLRRRDLPGNAQEISRALQKTQVVPTPSFHYEQRV